MGYALDSLPSHSTSSRSSSPSSTIRYCLYSLTTIICLPTRLFSRRAFLPSLIFLIIFILYVTDHENIHTYDSSNIKLQMLTSTYVLGKFSPKQHGKHLVIQNHKKIRKVKDELKWESVGREISLSETLETRLKDWESSPLEGEKLSDWTEQNLKFCSPARINANRNAHQVEVNHVAWSNFSIPTMLNLRQELINYLRQANLEGKMSEASWGTGKGLVFTAGNLDTFSRVLTTMRMLRNHLDTHLPAEIWSFPGEVPSDEIRSELEGMGVKFMTVENAVKDTQRGKSFHIKATAIIRSSFREVLFLDSDNLPAANLSPIPEGAILNRTGTWTDPTGIWESKSYERLGVMFWSDYWKTPAENSIWTIIGVPCRDEWEQESGQILIDKSVHLDALLLTEYMMDSSRFKFWMQFSDGDKDIFRFSFLALRKRWGVPGRYVSVSGFPWDVATGFGGHTMLQHDHLGRPLFVHANVIKMIPSGIGPGYAWGQTKSVSLPSPSYHFPKDSAFLSDSSPDLEDYGVDCDQLANADIEGRAIKNASPVVRRRAVMERGLKAFFHGGTSSALCVDITYKDIRTEQELKIQRHILNSLKDSGEEQHAESLDDEEESHPDVTLAVDGLEFNWGSPIKTLQWENDIRLRDFENVFFEVGGRLSYPGF